MEQTVAAIATSPGQGGIAVIRISGSKAFSIASLVFAPKNKNKNVLQANGYTALFGEFIFNNNSIDEGIALFFKTPHSYTGEDVVELSCHGGSAVSQAVLQACIEAGAMPAPAGEFTKRAVLNGRIGLTQAEAVMDLISATSLQAAAAAKASLSGTLNIAIEKIKQKLLNLAGHLTAYIDYPEEGVEALEIERFITVLNDVEIDLNELIKGYNYGVILQRGIQTAIIGSPNVGKSTLFNLISGLDRAIVTEIAGTTRDVVREKIQIAGIPLLIADTAGIRKTDDIVEKEGIKRSYDELEQAGLIIAVFDGSLSLGPEEHALMKKCENKPALAVINKSDLGTKIDVNELKPYFEEIISISATEVESKKVIEKAVLKILNLKEISSNTAMVANERQLAMAIKARNSVQDSKEALEQGFTLDAAGVCLEDAISALAMLTGEKVSEIVLENVFSNFCVGK